MTVNEIKALKQQEANAAIDNNGGFGLVASATGTGKSKIAVDRVGNLRKPLLQEWTTEEEWQQEYIQPNPLKVLLVVPTEKLRDEGWKDEFIKWDAEHLYNGIQRTCYASLADLSEGEDWDLVILDECHHITEANSIFFHNNTVKSCIGLTATPPINLIKVELLANILHCSIYTDSKGNKRLIPTYLVTLDEAVELGIVAPYDITVIQMPLNNTVKYIKGGYKNKPKMMTEKERYDELTRMCDFGSNPMRHIMRMRFIYDLLSKTQTAVKIIEHVIPKHLKTLIFCGGKDQANQVCQYRYYSKPTPPKKLSEKKNHTVLQINNYQEKIIQYQKALKEYQGNESYSLFFEGLITQLSCCEALSEGENIPLLDCAFIIQLNASERGLVQRIGRIVRAREGHTGKILILVAEGTKDMEWANKALSKLDITRIKWTTVEELKTGKYIINF